MMNEMFNHVTPFRFWCQKVIPLVYDDSLSYYELLCKVTAKLNELIDLNNKYVDILNEFKTWIENYFDSVDFQKMVNDKLDEMAQDGTLEAMVNGEVYGKLLHYVPDEEEENEYRQNILKTVVNWLERNHGGDYFEENNAITETIPITLRYATGKGYNGLYSAYKFQTDDMFEVNGTNCHVCWMDCTTFVSLIQKNILWNKSPYYEMMVNNDQLSAYKSGLISFIDTRGSKPYLTDAMGDITTYQEAFLLDMSGNSCLRLSKKTRTPATNDGVEVLTLNEENLSRLKTGDIIWEGDNTVSSAGIDKEWFYKCIHHNAIYVKDLEELNALTTNVRFKLSDSAGGSHPEYGYVVHCTNESSTYKNGIRIITLYDMMNYLPSYSTTRYPNGRNAERGVFFTSGPLSNTGVDSRSSFYADRIIRAGNQSYWRMGLSGSEDDQTLTSLRAKIDYANGTFETYSVGSKGARLRRTSIDHENKKYIYDANLYTVNGHFTTPNETLPTGYTREFRNFPKFALNNGELISCEIYISGFRRGDASNNYEWMLEDQSSNLSSAGLQTIIGNARGRIYMRGTTDNGKFRNWQIVGVKELFGTIDAVVVPAGQTLEVEIPFNTEGDELSYSFLNVPSIQLTPRYTAISQLTVENLNNSGVIIKGRYVNKLIVLFYNNTANDLNMSVFWRAYD